VLGFFTEEVRNEAGDRIGFDVVTLDGQQRAALARVEELSAAADGAPRVGKYVVDIASFESVTLPCLALAAEGKQPQLLLIDEMGKMEAFSDRFVAAIEQTLATSASRGRATLMVVANKGTGIIAACKARNDSSAFTLNEKSRDTLAPTAVTEKLRYVQPLHRPPVHHQATLTLAAPFDRTCELTTPWRDSLGDRP